MAQNIQYDAQGNPIKKGFSIKIAGFTLGTKFFVIVGLVILFIFVNDQMKKKEEAEALAAEEARMKELMSQDFSIESQELDFHAQMQAELTKQYGNAPEGFEWDYLGNLVAVGNDDEATAEDVLYMYMRALSILDFSTASKYAEDSSVISSYEDYYTDYGLTDYYSNFLRKQFKKSITSLEVEGVTDVAVFADGTKHITLSINLLDLTDKDFWQPVKEDLWQQLRVYKETEEDNVKLEQCVYDFIYQCYEDELVGKRNVTIELVVTKDNGGGWLIGSDTELNAMLQYENGVDVAAYILDEFDWWYQETKLKEQMKEVQEQIDSMDDKLNNINNTEGVE